MTDQQPRWVISGGIGSGKSAVRRLLEERGFFTIDADAIGHEVLARGGPAYHAVAARWPETVNAEGDIDRSELGRVVFSDHGALEQLEMITHPHIFGIIRGRIQGIPDPVAVEIPLLESPFIDGWRRLIVDSADETRLKRLVSRGMRIVDAESRMKSQPSRCQWLSRADLVVPNHGDMGELNKTVQSLVSAG